MLNDLQQVTSFKRGTDVTISGCICVWVESVLSWSVAVVSRRSGQILFVQMLSVIHTHLESISSRSCYATALLFINSSSTALRSSPERIMKAFCSLWLLLSLVELGPAPPVSQEPPLACRGAADPAPTQPEVKQAERSDLKSRLGELQLNCFWRKTLCRTHQSEWLGLLWAVWVLLSGYHVLGGC